MRIIINGKTAHLKSGTSFEYVSENRLFSGRDAYTLNLTFPLRHCPDNVAIFGNINRVDVKFFKPAFDCVIHTERFSLSGRLAITKLSQSEVECQFVQNRCASSADDPLEELFINELDLGELPVTYTYRTSVGSAIDGNTWVALPWVNTEYPEARNNWIKYDSGTPEWQSPMQVVTVMPYLIYVAKKICSAVGYSYDFSVWETSQARYILSCNVLPASWDMPSMSAPLPHWSVTELFEQLELLLGAEFDFDHVHKTVSMSFTSDRLASSPEIKVADVVDEFTSDVNSDDSPECDYMGTKIVEYTAGGDEMWNFYKCDWLIGDKSLRLLNYSSLASLINSNNLHRDSVSGSMRWGFTYTVNYGSHDEPLEVRYNSVDNLLHTEGNYFVMRSIGWQKLEDGKNIQKYILQCVNAFGLGTTDEDVSTETLNIVPVSINDTYVEGEPYFGPVMFLTPGTLENQEEEPDGEFAGAIYGNNKEGTYKTKSCAMIERGDENGKSKEFYSKIFVAYWDGTVYDPDGFIYPYVDSVNVSQSWQQFTVPFSFRLKPGSGAWVDSLPRIDTHVKYHFSWLADTIPPARSIYVIRGRRFLCEKITATFTEDGMSQLLKGEFWALDEN